MGSQRAGGCQREHAARADRKQAFVRRDDVNSSASPPPVNRTREKLREQLQGGALDERLVEIEIQERSTPMIDIVGGQTGSVPGEYVNLVGFEEIRAITGESDNALIQKVGERAIHL